MTLLGSVYNKQNVQQIKTFHNYYLTASHALECERTNCFRSLDAV